MIRSFQTVGILLLAAAAGVSAQNEKFRPVVPKGGGISKVGVPKGAPKGPAARIANPISPAAHLYKATPDQRDRALEKLQPALQQRLRNELEQFDQLPKEQRENMIRQVERFDALSPEKQLAFRQQWMALGHLEKERRQQVTAALRRLHNVTPDERARILARPAFRERFSPEEFLIITTVAEVMLP